MNPANVPPWGCPWHGPVQSSSLTLPNAATMAYPQPLASIGTIGGTPTSMPDTWGNTHLIKVPGAAAVTRTPAEQAADDAAGRQWRNVATLSGGRLQLYGKQLDGWIYIDPNGVRWRVQCGISDDTLYPFSSPLNATLTLSRFGDFGAPTESYSYPISLSAWQQEGYVQFSETGGTAQEVTSGRLLLDAINSNGAAAILMIHRRRLITPSTDPMIRWPLGFLQITLSGPGASAVASIEVVRSRAQTLQLSRSFDLGPGYLAGWYSGPPAYSPEWRVQLASTPPGPGEGNFSEWGGRGLSVFSGAVSVNIRRLLALWYDENDSLTEVAFALAWSGSLDLPAPEESVQRVSTGSASWTASIAVGAVACGTVTGAWTATTTETVDQGGAGSFSQTSTVTIDGVQYPTSNGGSISPAGWAPLAFDAAYAYSPAQLSEANFLWRAFEATTFTGRLAVVRYSAQVLGLRVQREATNYAYHKVATPSGESGALTLRALVSERLYGSWCPVSHGVRWLETSPVCFV